MNFLRKHRKGIIIAIVALLFVIFALPRIIIEVSKSFTAQETNIRETWAASDGELLEINEEYQVEVRAADFEASIYVIELNPVEIATEGFTFYDEDVQDRLDSTIEEIYSSGEWTVEEPLAIMNPYGTASNGLYLAFETDLNTEVTYTISAEGTSDYTATAAGGYTKDHEIQIIGLVPGKTNEVELTMRGAWGVQRSTLTFTIDVPGTQSGYSTQLSYTDGSSTTELADGLYAMMRTNGYLGYGFFFDNEGTMRYEMVLEGLGLDRILEYGDTIVTCASAGKIVMFDGLGKAERIYDLGDYVLHHDINFGSDGKVLALAEDPDSETVEDLVLEINLETGEVTKLIDFSALMADFYEEFTRPVEASDPFYWQEGEWDWIHMNSVQYMESDDSVIISSRETSSIIKVTDIHADQQVEWIIGDPAFWEGTPYEDVVMEKVGDFVYQHGQHAVEYAGDGETEGTYYLRLYDNNYHAISTRDDLDIDVDSSVGTGLYNDGNDVSRVLVYFVDENEGTFELVESFDVPYSSIVSNAQDLAGVYGETGNWVVNSGVANVFGEYDDSGNLIREFSYNCTLQGYRTFKYELSGFWFAE